MAWLLACSQAAVRYEPSVVEREWTDPPVPIYRKGVCAVAAKPSQMLAVPGWLTYAESTRGRSPRAPFTNETAALSRFIGRDGCVEYIEPLTGMARHPLSSICNLHLMSTQSSLPKNIELPAPGPPGKYHLGYLAFTNHCGETAQCAHDSVVRCRHESTTRSFPPIQSTRMHRSCGRNLFYDLGCSSFGKAMTRSDALYHGSAWTSSLQHFLSIYKENCIVFDRIWAWEGERYEPRNWWAPVPIEVLAKMHLYNVPLTNPATFIDVLNQTARREDHVVVKLDIDTPLLEKSIVSAILENPEIAALIDEFFFECHFDWGSRGSPWGATQSRNASAPNYVPDTVDGALSQMYRLRQMGIRSHFWI